MAFMRRAKNNKPSPKEKSKQALKNVIKSAGRKLRNVGKIFSIPSAKKQTKQFTQNDNVTFCQPHPLGFVVTATPDIDHSPAPLPSDIDVRDFAYETKPTKQASIEGEEGKCMELVLWQQDPLLKLRGAVLHHNGTLTHLQLAAPKNSSILKPSSPLKVRKLQFLDAPFPKFSKIQALVHSDSEKNAFEGKAPKPAVNTALAHTKLFSPQYLAKKAFFDIIISKQQHLARLLEWLISTALLLGYSQRQVNLGIEVITSRILCPQIQRKRIGRRSDLMKLPHAKHYQPQLRYALIADVEAAEIPPQYDCDSGYGSHSDDSDLEEIYETYAGFGDEELHGYNIVCPGVVETQPTASDPGIQELIKSLEAQSPPNGFVVPPAEYLVREKLLRRKAELLGPPRPRYGWPEQPIEFLLGLLGTFPRDFNRGRCPVGDCKHRDNPCYPAHHFLDLAQLMKEQSVTKNAGEIHIVLAVRGDCGLLGHPPYHELEIYAQDIMYGKVLEKGVKPDGSHEEVFPYEIDLKQWFVDCPMFLHANKPMTDIVLDYRIQDIIRPHLQSSNPQILLSYMNGNAGAESHRAKGARHYRQLSVLGQVIRLKTLPKLKDGCCNNDGKLAAQLLPSGNLLEFHNANPSAYTEVQPWSLMQKMGMKFDKDWYPEQAEPLDTDIKDPKNLAFEMARLQARVALKGLVEPGDSFDAVEIYCKEADKELSTFAWPKDDPYLLSAAAREKLRLAKVAAANESIGSEASTSSGSENDPYGGYDLDTCMSDDKIRPRCDRCPMMREAAIMVPKLVDWVEEVEAAGRDHNCMDWVGDDACVPFDERIFGTQALVDDTSGAELFEQLANDGLAEQKADVDNWHAQKVERDICEGTSRAQGGLVQYTPKWLSIEPPTNAPESQEVQLCLGGITQVVAQVVTSAQNLALSFDPIKRVLLLTADKIAHFDLVHSGASAKTKELAEKALVDNWYQPDLKQYGIPCQLLINVPITKIALVTSASWPNDAEEWWPNMSPVGVRFLAIRVTKPDAFHYVRDMTELLDIDRQIVQEGDMEGEGVTGDHEEDVSAVEAGPQTHGQICDRELAREDDGTTGDSSDSAQPCPITHIRHAGYMTPLCFDEPVGYGGARASDIPSGYKRHDSGYQTPVEPYQQWMLDRGLFVGV